MNHTTKLREWSLREETDILENQFGCDKGVIHGNNTSFVWFR